MQHSKLEKRQSVDITSDQYGYRDKRLCIKHKLPRSYRRLVVDRLLVPKLRRNKKAVFFDLAAGMGEVSSIVSKKFPKVTVIVSDLSRFALKKSKPNRKGILIPVQMDGSELALNDNAIDIIHCKDAIVHIPDLNLLFKELHRVTKKNASIVITFVPTRGYYECGDSQQKYQYPLKNKSDYQEGLDEAEGRKGWFIGPPFYSTSLTSVKSAFKKYFKLSSSSTWTPNKYEISLDWFQDTDPKRIVLVLKRK